MRGKFLEVLQGVKKYRSSEYLQNILGQAGFVLIGQLISILFSPLLTRLYDENAMAEITGMMSLSSLVLVFTTLKLNSPIVLEKDDYNSKQLFVLNIMLATFISIVFFIVVLLIPSLFIESFKVDNIIYYIPLYILLYSYLSTISSWMIRVKKFKANATSKIIEAIAYIIVALIFIWIIGDNDIGLAFGKLIGVLLATIFLYRLSKIKLVSPSRKSFVELIRRYRDFPLHSMPSSFINVISLQILVIFLGLYFSKEELGFFGLANMVILVPVSFISQSLSSIFFQKIVESIHSGKIDKTKSIFIKTFFLLTLVSVPIFLILYFGSPFLFSFIFGENWTMTGNVASLLALVFLFQVNVSPISVVLMAIDKVRLNSYWQYGRFVFMMVYMLLLAEYFEMGFLNFIKWYSYGVGASYLAYFIIIYTNVMKLDNSFKLKS